ncbi:hypothetical protein VC83_01587 [Pseudogymnoascus destructans]|uniref:Uncharacterized protein n=2 Tax=Pseudogymnoascus destructans TaxID=655981 RepID=L8G4C9_PSED2|nr:uncharacterized protein VC83_01587 [Pseudogymnoascus destructans]ELR07649.1 hypothetical protein GMDG_08504 [Pseudogymnoascus destructans 20631-21]OAF61914.1 hypothetical protein VC83_01587 [Pseudogymnoascus destructans]
MAKRKAPEELSTNVNTIKARNRVSNLTEDEKAVHLAHHADLSYYLKKLYKSAKYIAASTEDKTRLQNELNERIRVQTEKGTHASCIANQKVKNISASSSPQAPPSTPPQLLSELAAFEGISSIPIDDDHNSEWEDTEVEDDLELELMLRRDDILNHEAVLPDELSDEEIASIQALLTQARIDAHEESNFCKWQHFWDRCIRSYTRKAGKLRKKPEHLFEYMPWIDVEEGTFHELGSLESGPNDQDLRSGTQSLTILSTMDGLQVSTHSSSFKEAFLLVYSKKFDKEKWTKVSAAQDMLFLELE